ncbi:hypothetical protein ACM64Y_02800 [Novispirillum sp. DQ9]|uniref:hypothetical protein n=1 Tax=Novispirillum sp. DQ9 TaxID=3398612 RepID=UPI003C7A8B6B
MKIAYRGLALGALALGASFAASPSPAGAANPYADDKAKAERAAPPAAPAAPAQATPAPAAPAAAPAAKAPAAAKPAAPAKAPAAQAATPGVPAPKALPPDVAGECAWTGKRVVSLLARDDVDTAKRFLEFYNVFDCREAHLGPALRCVILESSNAPPDEPAAARVDRCWAAASQ